jgi:hypothetical protein
MVAPVGLFPTSQQHWDAVVALFLSQPSENSESTSSSSSDTDSSDEQQKPADLNVSNSSQLSLNSPSNFPTSPPTVARAPSQVELGPTLARVWGLILGPNSLIVPPSVICSICYQDLNVLHFSQTNDPSNALLALTLPVKLAWSYKQNILTPAFTKGVTLNRPIHTGVMIKFNFDISSSFRSIGPLHIS